MVFGFSILLPCSPDAELDRSDLPNIVQIVPPNSLQNHKSSRGYNLALSQSFRKLNMTIRRTTKFALSFLVVFFSTGSQSVFALDKPLASASQCRDFPLFPSEKHEPTGLAEAIYKQARSQFHYSTSWKYCDIYYSQLAEDLGLQVEIDRRAAMDQLHAANEELLNDAYISGYRWFELSELSEQDRRNNQLQIRYYPGPRFTHNQLLELWYEVLSPNNNAVTAVMNNRSIIFDKSKRAEIERSSIEPTLEKALNCARTMGVPRDIIACLLNLGCFYYIQSNFRLADRHFRQGLELARSTQPSNSPALAPLIDFEAMSARALHDYSRAEKLYLESLQIRTSIDGYAKPDVAHSLMNLSCLYSDWSCDDIDPKQVNLYLNRAAELQNRADEIMNPSNNTDRASKLMAEAIKSHQIAQSLDSTAAWKYKQRARELLRESESLQSNLVLVNSTRLSHGLGRPVSSCMTANQGEDKLKQMADFAQSISSKCEQTYSQPPGGGKGPLEPPKLPPEPGLATILGNWVMPRDPESLEAAPSSIGGNSKENKPTPVQGVTIYLCKYPKNPDTILGQIRNFGAAKGLAWEGLGQYGSTHGWPANHVQAEQLREIIDNTALSIAKRTTLTDKYGDYKFEGVPKGEYLLYASICTKKQCLIWLIPREKITVNRVLQYRYDFLESTGIKVWEDGHPSAPATPKEYFEGSDVKQGGE